MKILLVYPEFMITFWSWKHILPFVGKKAAFTPTGLLTVAAILPEEWEKKVVDLNVYGLSDQDIVWADYIFISAMMTQSKSTMDIIKRCKILGKEVILGGPILEMGFDQFPSVKHLFVGEAEETLPRFLEDLKSGKAERVYTASHFPDLSLAPTPLWRLVDLSKYASVLMQYGRGCPFRCTFCNVAAINGRVPRVKSPDQFLHELSAIEQTGYRGAIMLADDNFIGNKKRAKELLQELVDWQYGYGQPFNFTVEADITLADDDELMNLMYEAGITKVFLGIETPNEDSLRECGKIQNLNRDLVVCVRKIQNHGLIPLSGFIVGFDNDKDSIFAQHCKFYLEAGIVIPMIGVLQAPFGSELFGKLQAEGRIEGGASGNNTDCQPNFVPKIPMETLVAGYKNLVKEAYSPGECYLRIKAFLREYNIKNRAPRELSSMQLRAFLISIWRIGMLGGIVTSWYYWKTFFFALCKHKSAFADAMTFQIYCWHFRKMYANQK